MEREEDARPDISERDDGTHQRISTRQLRVLQFLAAGCSTKEIAARLSISPRTAQWHISRLMTVFTAPTRAALVMTAARRGLVEGFRL